ncbi:MAG: sodium:calcium antiporter, partial [Pseudomonadota bacterium]
LVLGVPALISTLDSRDCDSLRNWWMMMGVSVVFIALCWLGPLDWPHGLLLLALLSAMLWDAWRTAVAHRDADNGDDDLPEGVEPEDAEQSAGRIALFIAIGLLGLPFGAHLLINGAQAIARDFGIAEATIGLTLVAVGTSLPELATTVAAALRGRADVAIGNVIGSNLFNLAAVMGVAAVTAPLPVPEGFLTLDLWVMLATSAVLYPFVCTIARMGRRVGLSFLAVYTAYIIVMIAPPG